MLVTEQIKNGELTEINIYINLFHDDFHAISW